MFEKLKKYKKGYSRQDIVVAIVVLIVFTVIILSAYFLLKDKLWGYLQAAKDAVKFWK